LHALSGASKPKLDLLTNRRQGIIWSRIFAGA